MLKTQNMLDCDLKQTPKDASKSSKKPPTYTYIEPCIVILS